ncbi:DUF2723 domain-containing protein [Candidatus Desantisbacteria bacterium]|nr:DUF2723 domain-containing protein [Candidatus Desantisbacteria bacterium]
MNLKFNKYIPYIILFFVLVIYFRTLPASVSPGDPGELITACYTLGIPHPPGYPLYSLSGKIFSYIFPLGNIAFRINIMCMLFTCIGLILFYNTLTVHLNSITASIISTVLLAFTPTLWGQSLIAEVYSLNFLFFCILLYLELTKPDNILIYYVYGLAVTTHHTMLLLAPFFIVKLWKQNQFKNIYVYLSFLIGLSAYLYVFIRGMQIPLFNWGYTSTFNNFIRHITRGEYGSVLKNNISILTSFKQIWRYLISLHSQFRTAFLLLGVAGMIISFNKRFSMFLIFIITGIGVILTLNIPFKARELFDIEVFYIPSYVLFSFFIGNSISWTEDKINKNIPALLLILITLSAYQLFINFPVINRRDNFFTYNYGRNVLNTINKDGMLLVEKDNIASSLSYLMLVENLRKDVIFYNPSLQIIRNIYPSTREENEKYMKNKVEWGKVPLYRSNSIANYYREGLLYTNQNPKKFYNIYYNLSGVLNQSATKHDFETRDIIEDELFSELDFLPVRKNYSEYERLSELLSLVGWDNINVHIKLSLVYEFDKKYFKALKELNLALKLDPESADIHNSIGFVNLETGNYLLALEYHNKAKKINPNLAATYYGLGQVYEKLGNKKEAIACWEKYLEMEKKETIWTLEAERHIGHLNKNLIK